ncbi:hypothetical protein CLAFUW4_12396 [Fulvia fulva]|uniref:DUF924-domain-containing protein n=1 Tax=Passalora fulva TaxID=5499 RepID=A0A9Q8PEW6_PASFU|nr:uncharacterized protein CLAFUR5_11425 [Fulvia fulva]KAK4617562.1 hypothetical protein CLAFUR4_12401 [Fulvia fulva]KAK4618627.1 hypothetical protein CLAFUR0_12412 [Fulvia fulva]UJO21157.1 hypothetical protein CLAFUR5_11425 [Fulvia fulva]WPV18635.1 hypothetical protein CLAFUW4_12396 [Fulvia fulva]WPV33189.1 hypothetical protein CLAFUW7_12403 [Fulvia fulva]
MLFRSLLPRTLPLYLSSFKSYSTMASAVPPQSFHLDRSIWNDTLYSHIRSFWFAGLPPGQQHGNEITVKRWWGAGRSEEEAEQIDVECREAYSTALESIGPDRITLPPWKGYAEDLAHANEIAAPFISEVKTAQSQDAKKGADTALSLVLLLDQMPRNIYRDPAGLRLVYNHYDRISWSLLRSLYTLSPNPMHHSSLRAATAYKYWFGLPLMHAEDLESHKMGAELLDTLQKECEEDGDPALLGDMKASFKASADHREVIERFGRYPHRNEALGRESTEEESEWLKTGETFGVKQKQRKDEL